MRSRLTPLAPVAAAALAIPLGMAAPAVADSHQPTDLFFSEYVEGSSYNKALEIYNGTGAPVDLAGYAVRVYFNGSTSAALTVNLAGSLADGDVHVLAHASADPAILDSADQTNGASWYNGDDAITLSRGDTVLDVIGQIGFDPGSQWGTGLASTADNTLRRLPSVCSGDTDGTDAFDPAAEWEGFETDTFDGLGGHTADCGDGGTGPATPVINEFSASTTGTDVEYVEIYGSANTDYSAYSILAIEGDAGSTIGAVDTQIDLGTTDGLGLQVAGLAAGTLENGTISLLLVRDFDGAVNDDLDTNDDGVLDTEPWAELVDTIAVYDGGAGDVAYGPVALGPDYDGLSDFAPGGASRIPDGADTDTTDDWIRNNFNLAGIDGYDAVPADGEAYNTPGEPNAVYEAPPVTDSCETDTTPIYDIQGSGSASTIVGESVLTEGVVVGTFVDDGTTNFFIQDAEGDDDPSTSDGIFVNAALSDWEVGDTIRVRGTVSEEFGRTNLDDVLAVFECGDGAATVEPTEVSLPVEVIDDLEHYEGMLVTFPQELTISEYFNFGRFGEIVLTDGRQMTPTAVVEPGDDALALFAEQSLARITLDDGRSVQNPDPARHPNGEEFTLDNLFRGGDTVADVTGVLDYQFGLYRIQPTQGADHTAANLRPDEVPDVGGSMTVASFNVLNYFTTLGDAGRGADDMEELERQEAKIVAALAEMDADVVGLIEIENNAEAIERLVGALNAEVGADTYDYVDTGVIGTDAIKVAFIYKPATVEAVGDWEILTTEVDSQFDDERNRPALAQTFRETSTDGLVTVTVNHLKSKGSACGAGDDATDGSGNCDVTRTEAAEAMVDWLETDPTGSGSDNHLIIGDLNSYDKERPIDALVAGGYTDLLMEFQGEDAYTYVFDGRIGYLDYALANEAMVDDVTGAAAWLINADEPSLIDYDTTFKQDAQDALFAPDPYRSSDHDPVIVGLDLFEEPLDTTPPSLEVSLSHDTLWPVNHKYVRVTATVTASDDSDAEPNVELVSVTSNEPDNGEGDGNTVNDVEILGDREFDLRAERSSQGTGRIYTVTYTATDAAGNSTTESAEVFVPLSRGR